MQHVLELAHLATAPPALSMLTRPMGATRGSPPGAPRTAASVSISLPPPPASVSGTLSSAPSSSSS